MDRRSLLPWLLAAAVAGAVAYGALRHGEGSVDAPDPPVPVVRPDGPAAIRRGLRPPLLPGGFPGDAEKAIRDAWPRIEAGRPGEAAAALATLTPIAAESPFHACAPAALEALAPALEILIAKHEDVAVPAMRCAAALARAGGPEGRAALGRTGLLTRAFAQNALAGSPGLQVETAALLGFAGGDLAQEILVLLLAPTKPTEVRAAAAAGLGEAFPVDHRLRPEAVRAVMEAAGDAEPPVLRRACIQAMDRAWEAFRPYGPGAAVAAALAHGDRGLQLAAATFFWNHPHPEQGPALVAAVPGAGEEVLAVLADALRHLKPEGWREALEKRGK